jgi:CheY-like chemotaxis protein
MGARCSTESAPTVVIMDKQHFDTNQEDIGVSTPASISPTLLSSTFACTEACQPSDAEASNVVVAIPLSLDFRPRIAVVDGSPRIRQQFAHILSGLPYCLAQYEDGTDIVNDNFLCLEELTPPRQPEESTFAAIPAGNFHRNTRNLSLGEPTCPIPFDAQPVSYCNSPNNGKRYSPVYGGSTLFNILPTTEMIFINYVMPKLNGRDAVKRLRALGVQAPIVMVMTHTCTQRDLDVCKVVGASDVITGPLTAEAVLMMVAKHLCIPAVIRLE